MKTETKRTLISILFPEKCPYCGDVVIPCETACEDCKEAIFNQAQTKIVGGEYEVLSALPYDGDYKTAILKLKFGKKRQYAYQLAKLMAESLKEKKGLPDFDIITFVPLHPITQNERGFNQSELLAEYMSEFLDIPCETLIKKTKKNKPQHELPAEKRKENVKGVFRCMDAKLTTGKKILIVDDIVTTGLTLTECAKTLTEKGAEEVYCVTFAASQPKTT